MINNGCWDEKRTEEGKTNNVSSLLKNLTTKIHIPSKFFYHIHIQLYNSLIADFEKQF